jgi:hypothetical protein
MKRARTPLRFHSNSPTVETQALARSLRVTDRRFAAACGVLETSKVARCDEHGSKRRSHGHHSADHLDPAVNRRATGLALQLGLGLLAKRRPRINPVNCNNPRSHWALVNDFSADARE